MEWKRMLSGTLAGLILVPVLTPARPGRSGDRNGGGDL